MMTVVNEIARHAGDVLAETVGNTAGPLVTSLMVTAAAVTKNPDWAFLAVPSGAFAGAAAQQGVVVAREVLQDRLDRVRRFVTAVEDEAGQSFESFMDEYADDTKRELLGHVVDAATAARSRWKLRILARAFVRGARDGDLVDETEMFVKAVRNIEPAHARCLAAACSVFGHGGSSSNRIYASTREVLAVDSAIGPAVTLLWRQLRDDGLLADADSQDASARDVFYVTDVGFAVANWLVGIDTESDSASSANVPNQRLSE